MTAWWDPQVGTWVGAIGGSAIGVFGGLLGAAAGVLAPRGKARGAIFAGFALLSAVGVVSLVAGLLALATGQPWHVWYPLTLVGGILSLVVPVQLPVLRARYRQAELRRLEAEELRRA